MTALIELCSLIRSKNAGPFVLTFDFMMKDEEAFRSVIESGVIRPQLFSELYGAEPEQVQIYEYPAALALKVSIPRPIRQGSPGDNDCYGGQQQALLLDIEIDTKNAEA